MAYAQGTSESLFLGKEDSFKTMPATVNGDKIPVISPNIRPNRNKFQSQALTGVRQPRPVKFGKVGASGSFSLECNPGSLILPLEMAMGTVELFGGATVKTRRYSLGALVPWWIQQSHTDVGKHFLWNGIYGGGFTFNFGAEGIMEAEFPVMGARQSIFNSSQINGTILDRTGYDPFDYLLIRVKRGGVTLAVSQSVTLRLDNRLGQAVAQDETNEQAVIFTEIPEVTGSGTFLFQDTTELDLALTGTETDLEIMVPDASGAYVLCYVPSLRFGPAAPPTNGTGLVTVQLDFDAYARGAASAHAARLRSKYFSSAAVAGLSGQTLVISVDGAADQTVTFAAGDDTLTEVVAAINTQTTGLVASVERRAGDTGGVILLQSDTKGTTSSLEIDAASTATGLEFQTTAVSGLTNQSLVVELVTPIAA